MTQERHCSNCQLCCRLLPVEEIRKPAGDRCPKQRHHIGCTIYAQRPSSCRLWNCRWLLNDDTADIGRPDHCHYVIDVMPDVVGVQGKMTPCVVVWVDPAYPDSHRDPALRRYIERRAQEDDMLTMVRYDAFKSIVIFAPSTNPDNKWYEIKTDANNSPEFKERAEAHKRFWKTP